MLLPDVGLQCLVIYFLSRHWADGITQVRLCQSTLAAFIKLQDFKESAQFLAGTFPYFHPQSCKLLPH
jgi:hypothetical protein